MSNARMVKIIAAAVLAIWAVGFVAFVTYKHASPPMGVKIGEPVK